jgi:hypothetical protein
MWRYVAERARARLPSAAASDGRALVSACAQVVLTNQVTTQIRTHTSLLVPALGAGARPRPIAASEAGRRAAGESWAHSCTNRVMLQWEDGQRVARLIKSPSRGESSVPFAVTRAGIRGADGARKRAGEADGVARKEARVD